MSRRSIDLVVNSERHTLAVEDRTTLADAIRQGCHLTGTHLACEHGVCGACTVLVDRRVVRSCLMLAVQAVDSEITTVEGMSSADGTLNPVQEAFRQEHGLQCGFCTPGFIVTLTAFLDSTPEPTDDDLREVLGGNLCRCTGYQGIQRAARRAAGLDADTGRRVDPTGDRA